MRDVLRCGRQLLGHNEHDGICIKQPCDLACKRLFNQYGAMVINPARHPQTKVAEVQKFVDWVVSPTGQSVIAGYKINGEQLFFPNAVK